MPAIKRDFIVRNSVLPQAARDGLDDFRCDVLIRAAVYEFEVCCTQPTHWAVEGEVEIRRKLAAPQREPIDLCLPHRDPSAHCGGTLGIPECVHAHPRAIEGPEHLRVHRIEVPHVVLDLGEPILPRHPTCANASLRRSLAQIEPRQPLRRDEITMPIVEHAQLLQESRRELAVSVARKPDLPHPRRAIAQSEIPRGTRHTDVVLLHVPFPNAECGMRNVRVSVTPRMTLHRSSAFRLPHSAFRIQVTKMVTTSCGSATNRTVLPRPSSTRATDSRSSARTRWALFTLSRNRHAPAVFRPVAL